MHRFLAILIICLISFIGFSQNPNLHFGGNAYVDIGNEVFNGARTIELWFKLDSNFNENANEPQTLIARNTTWCNSCDEVQLVLLGPPLNTNNTGQLRFGWQSSTGGSPQVVFSDTNAWYADRWYHVAGVIDPVSGMRLYVDGNKQSQTIPSQTNAVTYSDTTTYIGKWGTAQFQHRYFKGNIENVRISSTARYDQNFTPECLNDTVDSITAGLWKFNEGSGLIAFDSSSNIYNGTIVNASWDSDSFCIKKLNPHDNPNGTIDLTHSSFKVYPNPSHGQLRFESSANILDWVHVYNTLGQQVFKTQDFPTDDVIDLSNLPAGTYFVVAKNKTEQQRLKLIMQ